MDHPLPGPPDALIRPWRTVAVIASAIAGIELLILLALGGGALVGFVTDQVETAAAERAHATAASARQAPGERAPAEVAAKLQRGKVRVLVLNGNGRQGAAAVAAARVKQRGYRIGAVGNAPRSNFARSIVMYRPGFVGEGRRLGRDLGVKQVTPLDGMRASQLGRAHVVFILGT